MNNMLVGYAELKLIQLGNYFFKCINMNQNIVKGIVHQKITFLLFTHFTPKCDFKKIYIFHTLIVHIDLYRI